MVQAGTARLDRKTRVYVDGQQDRLRRRGVACRPVEHVVVLKHDVFWKVKAAVENFRVGGGKFAENGKSRGPQLGTVRQQEQRRQWIGNLADGSRGGDLGQHGVARHFTAGNVQVGTYVQLSRSVRHDRRVGPRGHVRHEARLDSWTGQRKVKANRARRRYSLQVVKGGGERRRVNAGKVDVLDCRVDHGPHLLGKHGTVVGRVGRHTVDPQMRQVVRQPADQVHSSPGRLLQQALAHRRSNSTNVDHSVGTDE
mmetsp:Transcript_7874/g.25210  ORF Transcript_7874/g.25210 Transcript_7874/m.25210 type:complete len:254 (-) Transcript_7874:513-1274(-)